MPIIVERLPNEPIVLATVKKPFSASADMAAMYGQVIPLYREIGTRVALILDVRALTDDRYGFSEMMVAMAEAAKNVQVAKSTGGLSGPPRLIMVGSGPITALAAEGMAQEQYGGVKAELYGSVEEALATVRGSA